MIVIKEIITEKLVLRELLNNDHDFIFKQASEQKLMIN